MGHSEDGKWEKPSPADAYLIYLETSYSQQQPFPRLREICKWGRVVPQTSAKEKANECKSQSGWTSALSIKKKKKSPKHITEVALSEYRLPKIKTNNENGSKKLNINHTVQPKAFEKICSRGMISNWDFTFIVTVSGKKFL